jgi:hypothetical protein
MAKDLTTYTDLLKDRRYDPLTLPKSEEVVFLVQGKVIGTLSNYVVLSGLPKASKSTYASAILASAIVPDFQDIYGLKLALPVGRKKIAYFDTESSPYDFYRSIERIKSFAMVNNLPQRFDAYNFREDGPGEIKAMIETYLQLNPDCAAICIDGLLDLCLNINDEVESKLLTGWFKRITKQYNILMLGVLHLSKGTGETLGHLGSSTDRYAQSTLLIEKNKQTNQFILKPKYLRSSDDFEPIALMNFNGKWQQVPYTEPVQETIKKNKKS